VKLPDALTSLADVLDPATAMRRLVVPMSGNASSEAVAAVHSLILPPALEAMAWLYIDDLERAHDLCQAIDDATGAAIHAIVHRREGDFWNSRYWWQRVGGHPALSGQDPVELTKVVEAGDVSEATIERQRAEWSALAAFCAA